MSGAATNPSKYFKGGAKMLFNQKIDGVLTGRRFLGSIKAIGETPSRTLVEAKDYALEVPAVNVSTPEDQKIELSLDMQESDLDNHALRMAGLIVEATQDAGTVTDQAIDNINTKKWYPVGAYNISAVTVKKGATTADLHDDYEVDLVFGQIYFVDGGLFADGDDALVTYTTEEQDVSYVANGTAGIIEGELILQSLPASGDKYEATYWRAQLTADGEYPWVQDGSYGTFKIKATVLADNLNHPDDPLGRLVRVKEAA